MINPPIIELDTRVLDLMAAELEPRAQALLDLGAFNIQAAAMLGARVDTGAMRSSIYVAGASGQASEYGDRAAAAAALRPGAKFADEVQPADRWERVIGVAVEYGYWVELRYPFLGPAAYAEAPRLESAWAQLIQPRLFP